MDMDNTLPKAARFQTGFLLKSEYPRFITLDHVYQCQDGPPFHYPILAFPLGNPVVHQSGNSSTLVSIPSQRRKLLLAKGRGWWVWEQKIELAGKGHNAKMHCIRVVQFPPHHSCSIPVVPCLVLLSGQCVGLHTPKGHGFGSQACTLVTAAQKINSREATNPLMALWHSHCIQCLV